MRNNPIYNNSYQAPEDNFIFQNTIPPPPAPPTANFVPGFLGGDYISQQGQAQYQQQQQQGQAATQYHGYQGQPQYQGLQAPPELQPNWQPALQNQAQPLQNQQFPAYQQESQLAYYQQLATIYSDLEKQMQIKDALNTQLFRLAGSVWILRHNVSRKQPPPQQLPSVAFAIYQILTNKNSNSHNSDGDCLFAVQVKVVQGPTGQHGFEIEDIDSNCTSQSCTKDTKMLIKQKLIEQIEEQLQKIVQQQPFQNQLNRGF